MNQNRFRNDAKYWKEIEYVYYLIFSNVCQINSILGKRDKPSKKDSPLLKNSITRIFIDMIFTFS
jgi:hypothetical protein